ncbi:MT-A70 family methyltransferase [Geminicoccaceae bacterium 1502E]|nr:MT-A70 family methyltransferase [Geminicoccaceae bacterium 1502E]
MRQPRAEPVVAPPPRAGEYRTIYADPPWTFRTWSDRGKGRSPEAHYDCMSLDAIKALPVADWAAPDAVLLMWATDPLLPRALEVIAAWGFTYKTVGFYWAKLRQGVDPAAMSERDFFTGMGFWTRANPEMCLLATRGKPRRRAGNVKRLLVSPRREHSRKPDEAAERVEALCEGPYLEMFARSSRPEWDVWGQQAGLFDQGPVRTRRRPSVEPPREPAPEPPEGS